jgi:PPOX class probable FMN-dependent enzyme
MSLPISSVSKPVSNDLIARLHAHRVTTEEQIYAINGVPSDRIRDKDTDYLTPLMEQFVAAAPFFLITTADSDGNCDVSPKGDPAGVVRVLDSRTIAISDRLGNRRMDGHRNLLTNPHIGLIFIIPGVEETLRINGRGFITTDPELLETMAVQGKAPKLATVIEIYQAFMHCARAFLRSGLWQPEKWPDPDSIPSLAAIMNEQKNLPPPDESQGKRREEYRKILY